ncbi:hypothetical protein, partial [Enterococcus faecium]
GLLPTIGSFTLNYSDKAGANTLAGKVTLVKTNVVMSIAMTLDDSFNIGGTITIDENGSTLNGSNLTGNFVSGVSFKVVE